MIAKGRRKRSVSLVTFQKVNKHDIEVTNLITLITLSVLDKVIDTYSFIFLYLINRCLKSILK